MHSKLALGTAQFGMQYGLANKSGQVNGDEVGKIIDLAKLNGINTLDTAIGYGNSEIVLGSHSLDDMSIITKLPEMPNNFDNIQEWVNLQIEESLKRLNISSLDGVLFHRPHQLLESSGAKLYESLSRLKNDDIVKRIGISIYAPDELEELCSRFEFDLVQAPMNVFDFRLSDTGWLKRLQAMGTAVHVRSVFMQGLLLMTKKDRPIKFDRWSKLWAYWEKWLIETNQSPLAACLSHVFSRPEIEKIIVGVDSSEHLQKILDLSKEGPIFSLPDHLSNFDTQLLDPSQWNKL